jgi:hypothetical protein
MPGILHPQQTSGPSSLIPHASTALQHSARRDNDRSDLVSLDCYFFHVAMAAEAGR